MEGGAFTYHQVNHFWVLHPATPVETLDAIGCTYCLFRGCPELSFLCGGVCEGRGAGNGEDADLGDSSRHYGLLQLCVSVVQE